MGEVAAAADGARPPLLRRHPSYCCVLSTRRQTMSDFNSQHNRAVWFDVPVADLARAQTFYAAVLGIKVHRETLQDTAFCVLEHSGGNGGCLVLGKDAISASGGILVYFNVDRRIRDACVQVVRNGGSVVEPTRPIGPHGFRALVLDSEGNRIALHSTVDT
jgi:uncharacterized protein